MVRGLATSDRKGLVRAVLGMFLTPNSSFTVLASLNDSDWRGIFASFWAKTNTLIALRIACSPRPPCVHFKNRHRAPYMDGLADRYPCCEVMTTLYTCVHASSPRVDLYVAENQGAIASANASVARRYARHGNRWLRHHNEAHRWKFAIEACPRGVHV